MRRLTEGVHQTNDFQMQHTLDMLHFREQLFTAIFNAKHAFYLLGVGDNVKALSKWKYVVLIVIKDVIRDVDFKYSEQ